MQCHAQDQGGRQLPVTDSQGDRLSRGQTLYVMSCPPYPHTHTHTHTPTHTHTLNVQHMFFFLVQTEQGDIFKVTLEADDDVVSPPADHMTTAAGHMTTAKIT